jgi:hypothetical protein
MSAAAEEEAVAAAAGGAGAAPDEAVDPPENWRIDASSLDLCAVTTVYGKATFAVLNEFLGADAEPDTISQASDTTKKTGAFSDKKITYYLAEEDHEEESDFIHIDFLTKDSPHDSVGTISIYLSAEKAELGTIDSTYDRYKGAGTRMMTVFEDIARLGGYDTVVLKSKRTALGFYLGLEHPYTFARPANGVLYNKAFLEAKGSLKKGNSNRNARKAAAKTFELPGKTNLVPMTKTFKKRHQTNSRRSRRTHRTHRTRSRGGPTDFQ